MGWRETIHRLRGAADRQQTDERIDEEMRHHLELLVEEYVRSGTSIEEARSAALKTFGGVEQTREACRDERAFAWMETCRRDVGFALRQLRRSPVFTVTAVFTLALGIGASTAMFSVVNGVLLKPLPYAEADRLAVLRSVNLQKGLEMAAVSSLDAADWRRSCESFDGLGLYGWSQIDLPQEQGAMRAQGLSVTPEFFRVLTLEPFVGRVFSEEEFESRADVILLSSRLWRQRYDGDPSIVGRTIDVRSWRGYPDVGPKPYRVVGVIDADSRFLPTTSGFESRPVGVDERVDYWLPLLLREELEHREYRYNTRAIARLRSGVTLEQAQEELHRICGHLAADYPETNEGWTAEIVPLEETIVGEVRSTIWLLLGAIGFLLLVALANVASLLLVRGVRRQHELAVRAALGADRRRLIGQLVTETLVLGMLSGGVGVGVAFGGVALLKRLAPPQLPRIEDVTIDGTVLAIAVLTSIATGLLVGVIPAWLASRADSGAALNVSGRTRSTGRSSRLMLKGLAAGSVAIALVLLIGAGLLQQSLARVLGTELGFERDRLLTMQLSLPLAAHEWNWNTSFCHEVVEHVGTVPGIESVGAIRGLPTQETDFSIQFIVEGSPEVPDSDRPKGMIRVIGPGYFETTGIPLVSGRFFVPADDEGEIGHTRVTLVNQAAADLFWPGDSALGKRLKGINEGLDWMEVVGVVGDVRYASLTEPVEPEVYFPDALFPQTTYHLLVRTTLDPLPVARAVEHAVHQIEPDVLVTRVRTMDGVVSDSVADRRFAAVLLTAFSVVAFVIAIVGNYGVVACLVAERRRELGIRLALGAEPRRILTMVLSEELIVGLIGIGAGLLAALAGTRLLQSFLYGVEPTDPATYAFTVLSLAGVTGLAAFIPAWRASRLNPMEVLRDE